VVVETVTGRGREENVRQDYTYSLHPVSQTNKNIITDITRTDNKENKIKYSLVLVIEHFNPKCVWG